MLVKLCSFWDMSDNALAKQHLEHYFRDVLSDHVTTHGYTEIHVYSIMGPLPPTPLDPNVLYVQFSGESYESDPDLFHINLIPHPPRAYTQQESRKGLIVPMMFGGAHLYMNDMWKWLARPRIFDVDRHNAKKFCAFVVTNSKGDARNQMFLKLNAIKRVESSGRYMNNVGYTAPRGEDAVYFSFLNGYRFMICFENTKREWYLTEKLFHAYIGGCIPIYWGCPNVADVLNEKAFIHITGEPTVENFQQILELEACPEKYKAMYEQPLFKEGQMPGAFGIDWLKARIQDPGYDDKKNIPVGY